MRHILSFAFVLVVSLPAVADPKVEEFAPHASGVALAEVTAVEKFDARPMDGPAGVTFKLKLIRGSGAFPGEVSVITAHGGGQARGFVPKPSLPVKPDSFKKGDRVWFAFASTHEYEKHNQGVIGFWPEKDAKAEALEAAVKADAYRWHPQYDPKTKLTYGRIIEKDKWRMRVEKDGKELWQKEIPGTKTSDLLLVGLVGQHRRRSRREDAQVRKDPDRGDEPAGGERQRVRHRGGDVLDQHRFRPGNRQAARVVGAVAAGVARRGGGPPIRPRHRPTAVRATLRLADDWRQSSRREDGRLVPQDRTHLRRDRQGDEGRSLPLR